MMFQRLLRLTRTYRERVLSLVILPAFFLATLPHTACICADGHREAFCRATTCRFLGANTCSECSCCKGSGTACEKRSCCHAKHGQSVPVDVKHTTGLTAKTGSCCNPIVEAPAPAVNSGKSDLGSKPVFIAAIQPLPTLWSVDHVRPAFERTQHSTPPPLDAVIVYLHLTI
jgi:hypothetical protein